MSDLFISYSRDDHAFVERLHSALELNQKDVWLDCFDIPKGEKFWNQITQGIDSADAVIFIMSPSSVLKAAMTGDNAWCRREIEYAAQYQKRIIPVVYQEGFHLNQSVISHRILSERNWIFYSHYSNFGVFIKEISDTLQMNLKYVKKHTEITQKTYVWEERKREDKSTLLRGKILIEAENYLKQGEEYKRSQSSRKYSDPLPTELQKAYITASRKYEKFQRRVMLAWSLIPFVLFIPLEYFLREEIIKQNFSTLNSRESSPAQPQSLNYLTSGCHASRQISSKDEPLMGGEWQYPHQERYLYFKYRYLEERVFGNCRSINGANLKGAVLSGAFLSKINMYKSDLSFADLSHSMLNNISLHTTNFTGALLMVSNLKEAALPQSNFTQSDLRYSQLQKASLYNSNLREANLEGADLSESTIYQSDFTASNLKNVNLTGANLSRSKFGCIITPISKKCTNFDNVKWDDSTQFEDIQGWEFVENLPYDLKIKMRVK